MWKLGYVQLVDAINKYNDYIIADNEALYLDTLIIGSGAILDLNSYNLYYNTLIDNGGSFLNGTPTLIPEPCTVLLFGLGGLTLIRKRGT